MIHFKCVHCGWPVQVADSRAGNEGRCPSCQAVITIPIASDPSGQTSSAGKGNTPAGSPAVPPQPAARRDSEDEFSELENSMPNSGGETDILPADRSSLNTNRSRGPRRRSAHPRRGTDKLDPNKMLSRRVRLFLLTLLCTIIFFIVAFATYKIMRRW